MYELRLSIEGASEEEIRKGLDAARAVFEHAGVHPAAAAGGWWALQAWDERSFEDPLREEDSRNADVWLEAEEAAIAACCAGWDESRKPGQGALELVDMNRLDMRQEDDGTWTVYFKFSGEPVTTVGGGPLTGLQEQEAEEALDLIDDDIIEIQRD